jgi:hypothetical protein
MVLHRVGSAAGRKACAGSNPALSATEDLKFEIRFKFQISNPDIRLRPPCNLELMNPARTGR